VDSTTARNAVHVAVANSSGIDPTTTVNIHASSPHQQTPTRIPATHATPGDSGSRRPETWEKLNGVPDTAPIMQDLHPHPTIRSQHDNPRHPRTRKLVQ
jgi:hypothetical protein